MDEIRDSLARGMEMYTIKGHTKDSVLKGYDEYKKTQSEIMNELTDEELLSVARLPNEPQAEYKARRMLLKVALKAYYQRGRESLKTPYIDYVRLTIKIALDDN